MALPVTIASRSMGVDDHHLGGPFISDSGNVYVVLLDATDTSLLKIDKATDPTTSFSEVDGAHRPNATNNIYSVAAYQVGQVLHIVTQEDSTGRVAYHTFNMATDLWGIVNETAVASLAAPGAVTFVDVAVRSTGDVIVIYAGSKDTITMSTWERVKYARRVGGSWTINVAVDNGGAAEWYPGGIVPGSNDRMHFALSDRTNGDGYQRCLTSANVLETFPAAFDATIATASRVTMSRGAAYVSGGHHKIRIPYKDSDSKFSIAQCDSADTPTMSVSAGISTGTVKDVGENAQLQLVARLRDVYALWVDVTTSDLFRDANADGAGWGADATEFTGTINLFFANVFVRADRWKLAYCVLDVTTVKYNELDLGAAFVWDGLVRSQAVSRSAVR